MAKHLRRAAGDLGHDEGHVPLVWGWKGAHPLAPTFAQGDHRTRVEEDAVRAQLGQGLLAPLAAQVAAGDGLHRAQGGGRIGAAPTETGLAGDMLLQFNAQRWQRCGTHVSETGQGQLRSPMNEVALVGGNVLAGCGPRYTKLQGRLLPRVAAHVHPIAQVQSQENRAQFVEPIRATTQHLQGQIDLGRRQSGVGIASSTHRMPPPPKGA